jgi:excisionase family DNA binding protein
VSVVAEFAREKFLYTVPEAAEALGIGTRMVWAYVARKELQTRRLGKRRLIHRSSLEKFANRDHRGIGKETA